jgi:hypothetical protein
MCVERGEGPVVVAICERNVVRVCVLVYALQYMRVSVVRVRWELFRVVVWVHGVGQGNEEGK